MTDKDFVVLWLYDVVMSFLVVLGLIYFFGVGR
jgi:hypothetical protein